MADDLYALTGPDADALRDMLREWRAGRFQQVEQTRSKRQPQRIETYIATAVTTITAMQGGYLGLGRVSLMAVTEADSSDSATTAVSIDIPAIGTSITITLESAADWIVPNQVLFIDDGTNSILAVVTAISGETVTAIVTQIVAGEAGDTIDSGADASAAGLWQADDQGVEETAYNAGPAALASGSFLGLYRDPYSGSLMVIPPSPATTQLCVNTCAGVQTCIQVPVVPCPGLWYCLSPVGSGGTSTCYQSATPLTIGGDITVDGEDYTVSSGGYATQADCLAECAGGSGSSGCCGNPPALCLYFPVTPISVVTDGVPSLPQWTGPPTYVTLPFIGQSPSGTPSSTWQYQESSITDPTNPLYWLNNIAAVCYPDSENQVQVGWPDASVTPGVDNSSGLYWINVNWGLGGDVDLGCESPTAIPYTGSSTAPGIPTAVTLYPGACSTAPTIDSADGDICAGDSTINFTGSGFLPTGNTVTITQASGSPTFSSVTYNSPTSLTLNGVSGLTAGYALFAEVVNSGGDSGAVQIAFVEAAPSIPGSSADWTQATGPFTFAITGGVPGSTSVSLSSGTFTVVSVSETLVTVDFTVAPSLGGLTATITTPCGTAGPTEVANVVAGGGGGISVTWLGGSVNTASTYSTSITVEEGLFVLCLSRFGANSSLLPTAPQFGGVSMNPDVYDTQNAGPKGYCTQAIYSIPCSAGTFTLSYVGEYAPVAWAMQWANVTGLTDNAVDQTARNAGAAATPDSGATGTTFTANEAVFGAFAMIAPGGTWTWGGGFTSAGFDQNITITGTEYSSSAASQLATATGTFDASLGGVTPTDWVGVVATYS